MNNKDTFYTYNAIPYNIQDQNKNLIPNRNAINPSLQYKKNKVIYLHSAFNTEIEQSGTTVYSLTFDIPAFTLYAYTKLSVISYISNESSARPIIIKLGSEVNVDTTSYFSTDKNAFPIIYATHTGVAGMEFNNHFSLILNPQTITRIKIYLNDTLDKIDNGFTISAAGAGNFIIALLFEPMDLSIDNSANPYI